MRFKNGEKSERKVNFHTNGLNFRELFFNSFTNCDHYLSSLGEKCRET